MTILLLDIFNDTTKDAEVVIAIITSAILSLWLAAGIIWVYRKIKN